MGFLRGIFKSRDAPRNSTSGSAYSFFMGGTASGKRVNERSAMQMTAVYSCVRILSEAVAGLPLHFYRYTESGGKEKAVNHPLYFLLHDEPNPEMTSFVFRETLMTHLLLWGNAYAQIIRNGKGEVIALYPLMPDRMTVDRDTKGQLYYEYRTAVEDAKINSGSVVRLSPDDVLHIPGLGFDGLVGYSPIAMAKNAIGLAIAAEEYGSKFYANGAAPSGVLEHPGTIKDPSRVRESWQATFGGSGNSNKVAYWFQHDRERIEKRLQKLHIPFSLLDTSESIERWNRGELPVALIHPASAGHGLNLQAGGSTLVWFGLTWSLELYQQANARLWRQGQKNTVVIHHITTNRTIDERIMSALGKKEKTQSALIDAVKANLEAPT